MTSEQQRRWQSILNFALDHPTAAFTFSERLARENSWSLEYALRAIIEYKKFMFLLGEAPHPLTPSEPVDQVWHLHLIYTQSYWIDFCEKTLGKLIHHQPTQGGAQERDKFTDWYQKTLSFYEQLFDQPPPTDLWPSPTVRFRDIDFTRINRNHCWIIPKPKFFR